MKLNYGESPDMDKLVAAVLEKKQYRAELHIKQRDAQTYLLICLAGPAGAAPQKLKAQGPFHSYDQVAGSRNAIIQALLGDEFKLISAIPVWQLHAQAFANNCRDTLDKNAGDFSFDPKDVL
jgi:hypothetical protein